MNFKTLEYMYNNTAPIKGPRSFMDIRPICGRTRETRAIKLDDDTYGVSADYTNYRVMNYDDVLTNKDRQKYMSRPYQETLCNIIYHRNGDVVIKDLYYRTMKYKSRVVKGRSVWEPDLDGITYDQSAPTLGRLMLFLPDGWGLYTVTLYHLYLTDGMKYYRVPTYDVRDLKFTKVRGKYHAVNPLEEVVHVPLDSEKERVHQEVDQWLEWAKKLWGLVDTSNMSREYYVLPVYKRIVKAGFKQDLTQLTELMSCFITRYVGEIDMPPFKEVVRKVRGALRKEAMAMTLSRPEKIPLGTVTTQRTDMI